MKDKQYSKKGRRVVARERGGGGGVASVGVARERVDMAR
jgi:hypothetical protein